MRASRFNILDVTLHTDAIHRGGGQVSFLVDASRTRLLTITAPRLASPCFCRRDSRYSSSLRAVASFTLQRCSPTPDFKSPSTRSRFNAPRLRSEVSTRPSTGSVVTSSPRSSALEPRCTPSKLTCRSMNLSASLASFVKPLQAKLSRRGVYLGD